MLMKLHQVFILKSKRRKEKKKRKENNMKLSKNKIIFKMHPLRAYVQLNDENSMRFLKCFNLF